MSVDPPPVVTKDMTVLEVIAAWPETEAVLKRHDAAAGACICCNALFDTLQHITGRYGIDLDALMSELEAAAHPKHMEEPPMTAPEQPIRLTHTVKGAG